MRDNSFSASMPGNQGRNATGPSWERENQRARGFHLVELRSRLGLANSEARPCRRRLRTAGAKIPASRPRGGLTAILRPSRNRSRRSILPWRARCRFAPVTEQVEAFDLAVEGALPPELSGVYMRNGPNPKSGFAAHWFLGDGMLHGVR